MAEPFKNSLGAARVATIAQGLQRQWADFPVEAFTRQAGAGLDTLELKARALQIATALETALPCDFDAAAAVLEAALGPPIDPDGPGGMGDTEEAGLRGWSVWPLTVFVARRGLAQPERALRSLHAMTQRFTAEWAIRDFIETHPALTFATLQQWTRDDSAHVRRLVSEGSRPRLPWGRVIRSLIADPSATLPLLEALQDDPSAYVRRSVANHLNDIARDHPEIVADWLRRHLPTADAPRRALLRHASRTLIKRGNSAVLNAWGVGSRLQGSATLGISPIDLKVGQTLRLHSVMNSTARTPQRLVVDYRIWFLTARGVASAKVFKGWAFELGPGQTKTLTKSHSLRPITTRTYYPGVHRVELLINGEIRGNASFKLATDSS